MSVCGNVRMYVRMDGWMDVFVHPSFFIYLSTSISVCLGVCLFIYHFCLSIYLSIFVSSITPTLFEIIKGVENGMFVEANGHPTGPFLVSGLFQPEHSF